MDIVIRLELGLSKTIDDVLIDDDPHPRHQKGQINLDRDAVGVKEFVGDWKFWYEVAIAIDCFVVATIAEDIGEDGVKDDYCEEYGQKDADAAHEWKQ